MRWERILALHLLVGATATCIVTQCHRSTTATCEQTTDRVTCTQDGMTVLDEINGGTGCYFTCPEEEPGPTCPVDLLVPGPYNALSEGYGYVTAPPECLSDLSVECGATTCTWNTTSTCSRPTPPGPWTPADAPETATYTSVTSGTLPCNEVGTPQPVWVWTWPPVLNTLTPQPTLKPSLAPPTPACEDFTDAPFPTNKGGSVIKDCEWLQRRPANKKTQSCNRMTKWGGWCPATCGKC